MKNTSDIFKSQIFFEDIQRWSTDIGGSGNTRLLLTSKAGLVQWIPTANFNIQHRITLINSFRLALRNISNLIAALDIFEMKENRPRLQNKLFTQTTCDIAQP